MIHMNENEMYIPLTETRHLVDCPKCKGTHIVHDCHSCFGTGKVAVTVNYDESKNIPNAVDRGVIVKCPYCERCSFCGGTRECCHCKECTVCEGTGEVTSAMRDFILSGHLYKRRGRAQPKDYRLRLLLVMAAEKLQDLHSLNTDQLTLDLERAAGLSPMRPVGNVIWTIEEAPNREKIKEAQKQDAEGRAALIERLTKILENKNQSAPNYGEEWEKFKANIERMSIDDYIKNREKIEAERLRIQGLIADVKAWGRWHLEQRHENCGVCDELKAKNQRVAMCAEHGWTIPEGTTCPRCPGGELYNVPPIENKAKKTDEYYVAQARRYGELLVQGGVRQCPDPTCWCCGFGHRIDGQPWDAKDREAIEATIGLAVEDKERHARICEAASRVASAECGCGGPPNHVPGGIWCRK